MRYLLILPLFFACGEKDKKDETANEDTAAQEANSETTTNTTSDSGNSDSGTITPSADLNNPVIVEAEARCEETGASTDGKIWVFQATVTDPQGVDTLKAFMPDAIEIQDPGGNTVESRPMVCAAGVCTDSVAEAQFDVPCATASNFNAVFIATDEQGNTSDPFSVTCQ